MTRHAALAVVAALAAAGAAQAQVTGTVRYENRLYDANGLTGATTWLPIRQATVELVRADTGATIGTSTTTDTGTYAIVPTTGFTLDVFLRVLASVDGATVRASVRDNVVANSIYAGVSSTVNRDLSVPQTISVDFAATSNAAAAFNIFDSAVWTFQAIEYFNALAGLASPAPLPSIRLYWQTNGSGTFFDGPPLNRILLLGQASDNDAWDDDVILHELGHFVTANWSRDDSPGGPHDITLLIDPRLAWSEGAATWWSSAVRRHAGAALYPSPALYVDTQGASTNSYEIETPSFATQTVTARNEAAVAAALWDALDSSVAEAHKILPLPGNAERADDIWAILRGLPAAPAPPITLEDFFLGWESRFGAADPHVLALAGDPSTTRILNHRGVRYYLDPNEPNDTSGAAVQVAIDASDLTLFAGVAGHAGDANWFRADLPPGALTLTASNLRDGADTILELYADPAGAPLATHDDISTADLSSRIERTIAAGTYFIRVRPDPTAVVQFGTYDLAISVAPNQPPTVSVTATPQGGSAPLRVAFTVTASDAEGSVAIYEWDLDGDGAYEHASLDGGNAAHTFAAPGAYSAALRVTDNQGASRITIVTVQVAAATNASLTVTASLAGGQAPAAAMFTATPSGFTPVLFEWDFEADGVPDLAEATGANIAHTYAAAGTFRARVRAFDANGSSVAGEAPALAVASNPAAPAVGLAAGVAKGTVPHETTLTATAVVTPPATVSEYAWDVDGDGWTDAITTTNSLTARFVRPGIFLSRVTAMDDQGRAGTATVLIETSLPAGSGGWLVDPPSTSVDGSAIALVAEALPPAAAKTVVFEASAGADPAGPYSTVATTTGTSNRRIAAWDSTGLAALDVRWLRILADGVPSTALSVQRATTAPDVYEDAAGRRQRIDVNRRVTVWSSQGARWTLPARSSASAAPITVGLGGPSGTLTPANLPNGWVEVGERREVRVISGAQTFVNAYEVALPYPAPDGTWDENTVEVRLFESGGTRALYPTTLLKADRLAVTRGVAPAVFGLVARTVTSATGPPPDTVPTTSDGAAQDPAPNAGSPFVDFGCAASGDARIGFALALALVALGALLRR